MKITKDDLISMGCNTEHVDDWFQIRKEKRAPSLTSTALKAIVNQAELAGITLAEAIQVAAENGWRGFKAEWHLNASRRPVSTPSNIHQIDDARSRKEGVRAALRNIHGTDW